MAEDKLTLRVRIEPEGAKSKRHFEVGEQIYLVLTVWRGRQQLVPGRYDPGSVMPCLVGKTPDPSAADVSYKPWPIPIERWMRVVFKKPAVAMRLVCQLSELGGERAENLRTIVTVVPKGT